MAYPSVTNSVAGNSSTDITSGANWTFNFGFTATSGRLLILLAAADGNTTLTASGFTQVVAGNNFSAVKFHVFKKLSDGTETSVNISPNATETIAAILYEFSGHNGTTDVTGATASSGTSVNPDPPSANNFNSGEETAFIACFGMDCQSNPRSLSSYPTNFSSNQLNSIISASGGCGVGAAIRNNTGASEDPGTFTISNSDEWVATTVAIRSNQTITGTAAITLSNFTASASGTTGTGLSGGFRLSQATSFPLSDSLSIG